MKAYLLPWLEVKTWIMSTRLGAGVEKMKLKLDYLRGRQCNQCLEGGIFFLALFGAFFLELSKQVDKVLNP